MSFQNDRITSIPAPEPVDYDRQANFTDYETQNPGTPHSGAMLEAEFNAVQQALDETQARLRLIQRGDGALLNKSVGLDQLKDEALTGVNAPTDWAAFTSYEQSDSVIFDNSGWYLCLESHVASDDFAADLAAGKWRLLLDFTTFFTTEAEHWATYPVDQPVPEGDGTEYSAKHHATKAAESAAAASLNAGFDVMSYLFQEAVLSRRADVFADTAGVGTAFSSDGLALYSVDVQAVWQFTLTTAWDAGTISSQAGDTQAFGVSNEVDTPSDVVFSSDGVYMYVPDISATYQRTVRQYTLGTAWDVSTAVYTRNAGASVVTLYFSDDGTTMFDAVLGSPTTLRQSALATAWDISSQSLSSSTDLATDGVGAIDALYVSADGLTLVVGDKTNDRLWLYQMTTAFDVTTAQHISDGPWAAGQGFFMHPAGSYLYSRAGVKLTQYAVAKLVPQISAGL